MQIQVEPQTALVDEKVSITLTGFAPNQQVTVRARMSEMPGVVYEAESHATFLTDSSGEIHVDRQAPLSGTYTGIDGMGLFWSMKATNVRYNTTRKLDELLFMPYTTNILLSVEIGEERVAEASLHRQYIAPNVAIEDVRDNGLAGKFFYPKNGNLSPAVIVLGGGEGGLGSQMQYAALFASHGFPALALAYFKFEHLPEQLREIPLEYFADAIQWLRGRQEVAPDRIAVFGRSKGAELALLLGAAYPQVKAVIASSPSSTVCIGSFEQLAENEFKTYSSWSHHGIPLPFVKWTDEQCVEGQSRLGKGTRIDSIHQAAWEQCDIVEEAAIKVENINGAIMILTSSDDHWWPAGLYGEQIAKRLSDHDFSHRFEHLHYEDTGHMLRYPYVPTTQLGMNGGTAANNAYASSDSWGRVLAFLRESFAM